MYEFRPSRLKNFPYLCVPVNSDQTGGELEYCSMHFGKIADRDSSRWYNGLMGFYFKNRSDAVQFMLAWG